MYEAAMAPLAEGSDHAGAYERARPWHDRWPPLVAEEQAA
jgi:hypothetical protein